MKIITHIDEDTNPEFLEGDEWVKNWFDNRVEPVVRCGGDVLQVHFEPEIGLGWEIFTVDPKRSLALPIWKIVAEGEDDTWIDDFLLQFLADIGLLRTRTDKGLVVAFHTMMPSCLASRMSKSWMPICQFMPRHSELPRVINNPFFHEDPRAAESRLLEVVEDQGLRFAVDLTKCIPSSSDLAREISLLNHVQEGEESVMANYQQIYPQINDVLCGVKCVKGV